MNLQLYTTLKNKLEETGFPDFDFFYSNEVLAAAPEMLQALLEEEKKEFAEKISLPLEKVSFDTFDKKSILGYFWNYLNHLKGVFSTDHMRDIIEDFEPHIVAFSHEVSYSKPYYERMLHCFEQTQLTSDQHKILKETLKAYRIRGIDLPIKNQERLAIISQKLSQLSTHFSNNVLDSENEFLYTLYTDTDIRNLPAEVLERAQKEYSKQHPDQESVGYTFTASPNDYTNILKYCDNQEIRKDFWQAHIGFASSGVYDNRENICKILQLKQEKALLLGYKNYAELSLEFKMAQTPDQVMNLFTPLFERAAKKAREEQDELKQYFGLESLSPWDMAYYYTKLKQEKYQLDDKELKKYFEFERVVTGLHDITKRLFGLELKEISFPLWGRVPERGERADYGEDKDWLRKVRCYEVFKQGKKIAYYMLDPFYRPEKRSGAWADNLRPKFAGSLPVVINVCNFPLDTPCLLSLGEVETLFHEFGHATHEMLAKSQYADLSGFGVEWDFVEVPSQFLEHWANEQESLKTFAVHYKTGENIPQKILDTLEVLDTLGNGNLIVRQLEHSFLDMFLYTHKAPASVEELDSSAHDLLQKYSLFQRENHYTPYTNFSHIFAGGYAAGYYSYMWAEIYELDILQDFKQKGMFDTDLAYNYTTHILEAGSTKDALELFFDYKGREVSLEGFIQKKGI